MKAPVVIVGIGELAGPFALGFLRLGHPVHPVTRHTDRDEAAAMLPATDITLVTVREADLDALLASLPAPWRHHVGLVQNDLLPADWERHQLNPTIAVVWFEKKRGVAPKIIKPTIVGGPRADLVVSALEAADIPAVAALSDASLLNALVAKNLYIGVANIGGLAVPPGTTVGSLWSDHRALAEDVVSDVLDLQEALVGQTLERDTLIKDMTESFNADPEHGATGRSAPQRLERAIAQATELEIDVTTLRRIAGV
ncbi:MAG: hypothetical protein V3R84_03115 [Acidimicrobiia bacterium]